MNRVIVNACVNPLTEWMMEFGGSEVAFLSSYGVQFVNVEHFIFVN